jgi:hypothetical protein
MDRIVHPEIEAFKTKVLSMKFQGHSVGEWTQILYGGGEESLRSELQERFGIGDPEGRKPLR